MTTLVSDYLQLLILSYDVLIASTSIIFACSVAWIISTGTINRRAADISGAAKLVGFRVLISFLVLPLAFAALELIRTYYGDMLYTFAGIGAIVFALTVFALRSTHT